MKYFATTTLAFCALWSAGVSAQVQPPASAPASASAAVRPIVVELFTSQGCPSCPQADAVLKKIATNPRYLPLSFHVTYFDNQGWKDPFAAKVNTERQNSYVKQLGLDSMFTPQMVIEGKYSVVGSDVPDVAHALVKAREGLKAFPMSVTRNAAGDALDVMVGESKDTLPKGATLYEVHFNRLAVTPIGAGNNSGLTVENVNNVVAFFPVPLAARYTVPIASFTEDGIAYLLQSNKGPILGAAYYMK